jgi:tetratricopeptide (TPR) repeat protein
MLYFAAVQKKHDLIDNFHALRCLGDVFAALDDEETALHLFQTALEGATRMDIHRLRAECMAGIGDIMSRRGDMVKANEMWEAAIPLFIRSSQTKDTAATEARLAKLTLAQDHQEDRTDYSVVVTGSQATANQEESRKLEQLALFSAPQNSPSTVAERSMQLSSPNGPENATGESNCTIQYPFCY